MTTFRNDSGVRLELPALGVTVDPGDTFTVTDDGLAAGLEQQPAFTVVPDAQPATTTPPPQPAAGVPTSETPTAPVSGPAAPTEPSSAPATDASVDFTSSN